MKRSLIEGKDFHKLLLDKDNKFKEGSWEAFNFGKFYLFFWEEKKDLGKR
jgi:hypothetical protein